LTKEKIKRRLKEVEEDSGLKNKLRTIRRTRKSQPKIMISLMRIISVTSPQVSVVSKFEIVTKEWNLQDLLTLVNFTTNRMITLRDTMNHLLIKDRLRTSKRSKNKFSEEKRIWTNQKFHLLQVAINKTLVVKKDKPMKKDH
jgi:hypothetical protein